MDNKAHNNKQKPKITEIIVVEGIHDKQAIDNAVIADCIMTQGSTLSESTLKMIDRAEKNRGVIVFTDPDYVGERLRKIISKRVPGCKHAFLSRSAATKANDIGIENAAPEAIREALARARKQVLYNSNNLTVDDKENKLGKRIGNNTIKDDNNVTDGIQELYKQLPWVLMIELGIVGRPDSKEIRMKLADILHIGYANGKQFWHRLNQLRITEDELRGAMAKLEK